MLARLAFHVGVLLAGLQWVVPLPRREGCAKSHLGQQVTPATSCLFSLFIYFFYLFISSSEGAKVIFLSCTSHSGGDWNIHDNAIVLELKQFCLSSHKPGLWLLL